MTTGQRLAAVQVSGHSRVDAAYAPLAKDVAALILRYAQTGADGVARLTMTGRALVLHEIGVKLDAIRPELLAAILGSAIEAGIAASDDGERVLDSADTRTTASIVWRSLGTDRLSVISQTGALLVRGIAAGMAASVVAKAVGSYFSPWYVTRRDAEGNLVRAGREGGIRAWPGRAGMASQHARTVMLTEATAAHGRATRIIAERNGQGLRWNLSPRHKERDLCDERARADVGYGPGNYLASEFPSIPSHPQCRCFSSTVDLA